MHACVNKINSWYRKKKHETHKKRNFRVVSLRAFYNFLNILHYYDKIFTKHMLILLPK